MKGNAQNHILKRHSNKINTKVSAGSAASSSLQMNEVCKLLKECKSAYIWGTKAQILCGRPGVFLGCGWVGEEAEWQGGIWEKRVLGEGGAASWCRQLRTSAGWRADGLAGLDNEGAWSEPSSSTPGPLLPPWPAAIGIISGLGRGLWAGGECWEVCLEWLRPGDREG